MRCEICGGPAAFYFSKTFDEFGLSDVDYWRCGDCGFVISRTHAEMTAGAWEALNAACHGGYQGTLSNPLDPKWRSRMSAQAKMLGDLAASGLLSREGRWLDYGCGDGGLSDLVEAQSGLRLLKHDAYMPPGPGYLGSEGLKPEGFDLVLTTSVFEHIRRREDWDAINALVAPGGAMALHTLVAETVPRDPNWFYLQPPHCAFFTNAAMTRLFDDWGYRASVYSPAASLWVWFRADPGEIERGAAAHNAEGLEPLCFKAGFLDYWKSDPRTRRPEISSGAEAL